MVLFCLCENESDDMKSYCLVELIGLNLGYVSGCICNKTHTITIKMFASDATTEKRNISVKRTKGHSHREEHGEEKKIGLKLPCVQFSNLLADLCKYQSKTIYYENHIGAISVQAFRLIFAARDVGALF